MLFSRSRLSIVVDAAHLDSVNPDHNIYAFRFAEVHTRTKYVVVRILLDY